MPEFTHSGNEKPNTTWHEPKTVNTEKSLSTGVAAKIIQKYF